MNQVLDARVIAGSQSRCMAGLDAAKCCQHATNRLQHDLLWMVVVVDARSHAYHDHRGRT